MGPDIDMSPYAFHWDPNPRVRTIINWMYRVCIRCIPGYVRLPWPFFVNLSSTMYGFLMLKHKEWLHDELSSHSEAQLNIPKRSLSRSPHKL